MTKSNLSQLETIDRGSAAYSLYSFSSMGCSMKKVVKKTLRNFYKSLWVDLYVIRVNQMWRNFYESFFVVSRVISIRVWFSFSSQGAGEARRQEGKQGARQTGCEIFWPLMLARDIEVALFLSWRHYSNRLFIRARHDRQFYFVCTSWSVKYFSRRLENVGVRKNKAVRPCTNDKD